MFGVDKSIADIYKACFGSDNVRNLKYKSIEMAVNNIPLSLGRSRGNEFSYEVKKIYYDKI